MKIVEEKKSFGPKELPPVGTQCARLIQIVDLGTQETEFQGQKKNKRQVRLTWELVDAEMSDGRKFVVGKTYNASLYKSSLLDAIQSMTGKPVEFESDGSYDMKKLLDSPCMITVVHTVKGDKTYANIASLSPLPMIKGKTIDCEASTNHLINFGFDLYDQDTYDMIPAWVQAIIEKSPEYRLAKQLSDSVPF